MRTEVTARATEGAHEAGVEETLLSRVEAAVCMAADTEHGTRHNERRPTVLAPEVADVEAQAALAQLVPGTVLLRELAVTGVSVAEVKVRTQQQMPGSDAEQSDAVVYLPKSGHMLTIPQTRTSINDASEIEVISKPDRETQTETNEPR